MTESICIVCGKEDGGTPWQLMPVHPECRKRVTEPDLSKFSETQEYPLGTKFMDYLGRPWIYIKKDAGIVGTQEGKSLKSVTYKWE